MFQILQILWIQKVKFLLYNNIQRLFPSLSQGHNNFYQIDDRDDELSRSSNGIIESGSSMTLHRTENLQSASRIWSEPESFALQSVTLTTWSSLLYDGLLLYTFF